MLSAPELTLAASVLRIDVIMDTPPPRGLQRHAVSNPSFEPVERGGGVRVKKVCRSGDDRNEMKKKTERRLEGEKLWDRREA